MVRCLRTDPLFRRHALPSALCFLEATQQFDGGWGTISVHPTGMSAASDADTTGCVLLALDGTPQGRRIWPAAAGFARAWRTCDGIWATWKSTDDAPAYDPTAHVVAGVRAHGTTAVDILPAVAWLGAEYERHGKWASTWYSFPSYGVREVAEAIGWQSSYSQRALHRLVDAQQADGGWVASEGMDSSSPAATGLALSALVNGTPRHPNLEFAVERGIAYLVDTQNSDGTWTEKDPFMLGPRPYRNAQPMQSHAWASLGLRETLLGK